MYKDKYIKYKKKYLKLKSQIGGEIPQLYGQVWTKNNAGRWTKYNNNTFKTSDLNNPNVFWAFKKNANKYQIKKKGDIYYITFNDEINYKIIWNQTKSAWQKEKISSLQKPNRFYKYTGNDRLFNKKNTLNSRIPGKTIDDVNDYLNSKKSNIY